MWLLSAKAIAERLNAQGTPGWVRSLACFSIMRRPQSVRGGKDTHPARDTVVDCFQSSADGSSKMRVTPAAFLPLFGTESEEE